MNLIEDIEEEKIDNTSEYLEDQHGRKLRKIKIIDWKKSLLKKNWDVNKSTVFNIKGDPRSMKAD